MIVAVRSSVFSCCVLGLAILGIGGCGNPVTEPAAGGGLEQPPALKTQAAGELVTPPFEVTGELEGLLLVWFDNQGVHTAQKRSEIPEARRALVRIDSLRVAPEQRLDPDHVYLADLRAPASNGTYSVRRAARAFFDAKVDQAKPPPTPEPASASVVVYGASWCGVCKTTEAFLREKHVPFVEKDIEKDPAANAEMLQKAQAKGLSPRGVPVIDFRGEILLGFDQARLEGLIDHYAKAI